MFVRISAQERNKPVLVRISLKNDIFIEEKQCRQHNHFFEKI